MTAPDDSAAASPLPGRKPPSGEPAAAPAQGPALGGHGPRNTLSAEERGRVLVRFNTSDLEFARGDTVVACFEHQVDQTPEATALDFEGHRLTYRQLDERANQLARHLRSMSVGPEIRVALLAERSVEQVVGMLAILKAGGAFVPLEPAHPPERLSLLLSDSGAPIVLGQQHLLDELRLSGCIAVELDGAKAPHTRESRERPGPVATADHLAYVLYTSGSTGRPKGVLVVHAGLRNTALAAAHAHAIRPEDRVLQFASAGFDASVCEVFSTLVAGATLVLAPRERLLPDAPLRGLLREQRVTAITLTPSVLAQLETEGLEGLRTLISVGEALPESTARRWGQGRRLLNAYGPTEVTVCASITPDGVVPEAITLGTPWPNTRLYVLDDALEPLAPGVAGELYISGVGVARGYLGRPDLTAERFLPNPFSTEPGARLYRTGDLTRWTQNGELEYLGRADAQVKVRGMRVEPGEVESVLARHPEVREAAVVARRAPWGELTLVAFYVRRESGEGPLASAAARTWLRQQLPEHLVPSALVPLPALPLTPSGKVDRQALAVLPFDPASIEEALPHEEPRGELEQLLAELFQQVLGTKPPGRDSDFFEMGGHSLSATRLLARVHQVLGRELPLATLFATPTVAALAQVLSRPAEPLHAPLSAPTPLPPGAEPTPSLPQERMWFLQQLQPDSAAYLVVDALEFQGPLHRTALEDTLRLLLERHAALRVTFFPFEGTPRLRTHEVREPVLTVEHLSRSTHDTESAESWLQRRMSEEAGRPFSLEEGPLYRFRLFVMSPERHVLLVVLHHIVVDGLSMDILFQELAGTYSALSEGREPDLAPMGLDYAAISAWQRTPEVRAREESHLEYWKQQLAGAPTLLSLPTDRPRPSVLSDRGALSRRHQLSAELRSRLDALCRHHQVTPFMALLSVFTTLLHRYSGERDLCIGVPVSGRNHPSTHDIVGPFINTLVLRTQVSTGMSFAALLEQVRSTSLDAFANQEAPFEQVVEALQVERSLSHSPLFQVMFDLRRLDSPLSFSGLSSRNLFVDNGTSQLDLALTAVESPDSSLLLFFQFRTDLFDLSSVDRFLSHFLLLLEQSLSSPSLPLSSFSLLDPLERRRVLFDFNDSHLPFDSSATLASLLEASFSRHPHAVALVAPDATLTFSQLFSRASLLASHLAALGARPESVVAVCLERSSLAVVSLLAVHLSGAACLPLEPSHPHARRALLLQQANALLVLSSPALFPEPLSHSRLVSPDDAFLPGAPLSQPLRALPHNLAYVLFTSGSTGTPKGVLSTQQNVVHCFDAFDSLYSTSPGHTWAASGSLSFDIHQEEILFSLSRGARVILRDVGPLGLSRDILSHRISHVVITPSSLASALEEPGALDAFRSLSVLVTGGEVLPDSLVQSLALTSTRLVNTYGPTEASINVAAEISLPHRPVRLGRPLPRCLLYVLDDSLQPLPPGLPGNLFISGICLARGYHSLPHLTAERFLPNPFSSEPGSRLYDTGDRARWNDDGSLSFLGRSDFQLKLRGVRIEVEEIEAALLRLHGVRHAAVLPFRSSLDSFLVAFLVLDDGAPPLSSLRDSLSSSLPEALVPSRFLALPSLPFTTSGKLDRGALSSFDISSALVTSSSSSDSDSSPRGQAEALLSQLFADVLSLPSVPRDADFFSLGGHSLSASRLVSRIRLVFGVELPLSSLFSSPSVASLAPLLSLQHKASLPSPTPSPLPPQASFAQERLWFLHQLSPGSAAYVMPEVLELKGPLDVRALEKALRLLPERHSSLRAVFRSIEGHPRMELRPVPERVLAVENLLAMAQDEEFLDGLLTQRLREESARAFSLEQGPLYRFRLFRLAADHHVLLVVLHHIIVDGLSMDRLLRELAQGYSELSQQRSPVLPLPALDYTDISAWQRTPEVRAREESHLEYWKQQLAGAPALLSLPTDRPRPSVLSDRGSFSRRHQLSAELRSRLDALCRHHQVTPFMALLSVFTTLLHRYSGERDLSIGVPVSGRTHPATQDVVGLFLNTLVLRTQLEPGATFSSLLTQVRTTTLEALNHQEAPFERVVEALQVERSLSHSPLFQVMFDLRRLDSPLSFSGLSSRNLFVDNGTSQLDLALTAVESPDSSLLLFFQFRTDLFDLSSVDRFLSHFLLLLEQSLSSPSLPLSSFSLLDSLERRRVLFDFNDSHLPFDSSATLASLLEASFSRHPHAVALVAPDATLTFSQLFSRASLLASHLAALGARPESVVAVCLERSSLAVVSLLAVHLSGAACLPLEPSHPHARRALLLQQANALLVLSSPALFPEPLSHSRLVSPDDAFLPGAPLSQPLRALPHNLAYVLFTSGSTGTPKGVLSTQQNVVHCFDAFDSLYSTSPGHTWAASGSLSFDIHQEEILFSLSRGARVILRDVGPLGLSRDILSHRISHVVITPSSLASALEEPGALDAFRSLSVLVTGGEVLPDSLVQSLALTSTRLVNTYGPTEASINVAAEISLPHRPVRLGRPLPRCLLYVLDDSLQPLPPGLPGNLFISGICLARGYHSLPHLTAERFLPNPFSSEPGSRLYDTGDRARWNDDGSLSFLGRSDFQLKLRGVRIEVEEIEAALLRLHGVRHAAVLPFRSSLDSFLVAFLVLDDGAPPLSSLRDSLSSSLPEALVPSRFLALPSLPFTTSGKLDRGALSSFDISSALVTSSSSSDSDSSPRGQAEALLSQLFADVLSLPSVPRDADFFSLGGHSLSASRLVSRIRLVFGVELPLSSLFSSPSVASLAPLLSLQHKASLPSPTPSPLPPQASFAQERLWFLHQLSPELRAYNIPEAVELRGALDVEALDSALRLLLEHHPVLRTTFVAEDGRPVPRRAPIPAEVLQVESLPVTRTDGSTLNERLREESTRAMSLEQGPLYRFRLFRLAPEHHVLLLVLHHVVVDGLSIDVLLRHLSQAYAALHQRQAPLPPRPSLDYADAAAWQRSAPVREREDLHVEYWKRQLAGAPTSLSLPTDKPRPAVLGDAGALSRFQRLSPELEQSLAAVCREHHVTPFMVLGAAFAALLHRHSGQDDVSLGTPVAGRPHPALEDIVGLFTNTVVLRTRFSPGLTFAELLASTRTTALEAFAHQDAPFERVVDALQVERSLAHAPLFQVGFFWERAENTLAETFLGLEATPLVIDGRNTQSELALTVSESAAGHELSLEYSTDLFEAPTIERLLSQYVRLLEEALATPSQQVAHLSFLDAAARQQVLRDFNDTQRALDPNATLVSLIEAQVDRAPELRALTFEGQHLTYGELETRANQLARHLQSLGAGPEVLVGVCLERSLDLVVALLGILKSGAAYLPLDPELPRERLAGMLEDGGAPVIITRQDLASRLPPHVSTTLLLDAEAGRLAALPSARLMSRPHPDSLAYVIFTSGSTGRPKGAMNSHRAAANRLMWMQDVHALIPGESVLQKTPTSFDVSVWELFWPLTAGARMVLARPGGHREPAYLARLLADEHITIAHFVPSMLGAFLEEPWHESLTDLRKLVCSGEALSTDLVQRAQQRLPATEVHNLYGPTEAAVEVTHWHCRRGDTRSSVPIGRPVANTRLFVLDSAGHPVPVGVPGELHIGGIQVGRGYWRRPELTAERFIPDAFSDTPGACLYRTGDLARWRGDGTLEYLGRTDFQVKVRGQRIELEEIELALRRLPSVRDAVVGVRAAAHGDARLVAYVVPREEHAETVATSRAALKAVLPEAMVPSAFIVLDALPLTPSGKVDRGTLSRLPLPEAEPLRAAEEAPPRGPLEQLLASFFRQVLGVEKVSRDADFFALGGHSLSATRLVSRIRRALGQELPLKDLFLSPTVAGIAQALTRLPPGKSLPLPAPTPRPADAPALPSFSQERMWFLQQLQPDSASFSIPEATELHGPLDAEALESAVLLMLERHSALRSTFLPGEPGPRVELQPIPMRVLDREDLSSASADEAEVRATLSRRLDEEVSRPFSLETGPLYRFNLFLLAPEHHVFLVVLHHTIADGLSVEILLRELTEAYAAFHQNRTPGLEALPLEFLDIAAWQRTPDVLARQEVHLEYWRRQLDGAPTVLELPTDKPRHPGRSHQGAFTRHHPLPKHLGEALDALCREHQVTPFMVLYAAFAALLHRYTGQAELNVGTPVSGRTHADVEPVVGLFINTVVLRTQLDTGTSFASLLRHVRTTALDAFAHQEVPFERVVEALQVERSLSHTPLFQVMFQLSPSPRTLSDGFPGLEARPVGLGVAASLFDLMLSAEEHEGRFGFHLEYPTALYDAPSAERMVTHYLGLLSAALLEPSTPVGQLPLLSAAERQQVLVDFNTSAPGPRDTVLDRFAAQVARTPDADALIFEAQALTYQRLHARSNQFAHFLRELGVGPETRVALCLERSPELVVSMLSVLKAGGAYVPLDPTHPPERLIQLLGDSGAHVLVTTEALGPLFASATIMVAYVDSDAAEISRKPEEDLPPLVDVDNLAYVIFTSGSTGTPKGAMLTHRGLCNTALAARDAHGLVPGRRMLQFAASTFDGSVWETFATLLSGATLVMAPRERLMPDAPLRALLLEHRVTDCALTPTMLTQLAPEGLESVQVIVSAGEPLSLELARRWAPGRALLNSYGPTEVTVAASVTAWPGLGHPPGAAPESSIERITVGTPWPDTHLFVLDERLEPLPPGVPGELYVGGIGLARGYLGRPDLTAERFIPHPFALTPGERLYRTGDRVRWLADGQLEYLGRLDTQLKVRGIRVEPGEIEVTLARHPGVREAVVVPRTDAAGDTRLVAFIVPSDFNSAEETVDALPSWLRGLLPEHLVPATFVPVEALPLTASRKVDRKALSLRPLPRRTASLRDEDTPRGATEEQVALVFQDALGLERVPREAHFFELGGHSLSATRVVARLRQSFRVELSLAAFFTRPTVASVAALIDAAPRAAVDGPIALPRPEVLPTSLVQERLWYALQLPHAPPYVLTLGLLLEGALDVDRLEQSLAAVVERNESLRATFAQHGDSLRVQLMPPRAKVLSRVDLSHLSLGKAMEAASEAVVRLDREHFDLERGPLYRFELLRLDAAGTRHALVLAFSHIINDGVGLSTFAEELATAWNAATRGEHPLLPALALQYTDYALWQRHPEQARRREEGLASWKQALAQAPALLDLPLDFPRRAPALNDNMRAVAVSLSREHSDTLRALARSEGVSPFTVLLALTQAWLHRLSGQSHVVVATTFSGRSTPQVEKLLGYFANVLPLCTELSGAPTLRELLRRVRDVVAHATTHQDVPFKRIADAVQPDADRTAPRLAQVLLQAERPGLPQLEGLSLTELSVDGVIPAYDVVVSVTLGEAGALSGFIALDGALFTPETGERFARAFEQLAASALDTPELALPRLSMLSPRQRAEVLAALAGPAQAIPPGACIHTLFEAQVRRTPHAPAVAHGDVTWSYAELNARANLLAAQLLSRGLVPEERVGVVMEPSTQAMAVLLGILKAGGAYVPMDADWPEPRKRDVMERAEVHRLWVDDDVLEAHRSLIPDVEVPPRPSSVAEDLEPGPREVLDAQTAYIVFTSGSTGEPKGVMVEHRSVVNHNLAIARRFRLEAGDRMLQFAPLTFDAAAEDLYPPLAVGGTVVMRSGLVPAHAMTPYLEETGITLISLPPTYIEEWIRQMEALGQRVPSRLKLLAPGGDVLKKETFEAWVRVGGGHAPWVNVYGPTECTITSATCDIPGEEGLGTAATFPIGRPMPRVCFYLLDEHLEPVPPGLPGRVYIGGAALSRGYLRAPHLTSERFLPDPFSPTPGARMYHTGDLARLQPDGRLRFLGRADHQVKIRGFRIELSEIETCLRRHPLVQEAVVIARVSAAGTTSLCAYVQAPGMLQSGVFREHVAALLPGYMVPATFVVMEALPVNANGKVDRKALPDPDAAQAPEPLAATGDAVLETPFRTSLEMVLQRLWKQVLGRTDIQASDDFFALGGDSILAMRVLALLEEELGVPLPLATLFQSPTLGESSDAILALLSEGPQRTSVVRLASPQAPEDAPPLFLFHAGDGEVHHYRDLVPRLEPHVRCFGIQAPEALTSGHGHATLEARVEAYAQDIRALQPHGPYRLAGFSFGGYPALGVAAVLEAQGETVEFLALMDTATSESIQAVAPSALTSPTRVLASEFGVLDAVMEQELAALPLERQWEHVARRAREKGTAAPHFQGADFARVWRVLGEVLTPQARAWRTPTTRVRPRLFTSRALREQVGDVLLGWTRHFPREHLDVVELEGEHATVLHPPEVDTLAARLLAALGKT
ncbi:non-ribosomal peptide synthase/polyketide synthase [Myxococcus stipitatus]|uniref:non-ribosomal peptide synthetase n=1 Tax=Myxococcus stipitatus TaxID=83455 RepID=UPI0030CD91AB